MVYLVELLSINFYFAAKLLVVGGFKYPDYATKSEIIDLINPMNVCQPWADHPTGTNYAAGAFINNALHICGGYYPADYPDYYYCFLISPTSAESTISLRTGSRNSAAVKHHGAMLYTGGYSKYFSKIRNKVDIIHAFLDFVIDGNYDWYLKRTEKVSKNESSFGPDLPYPVGGHCIVKLSDDSFYLIGGYAR